MLISKASDKHGSDDNADEQNDDRRQQTAELNAFISLRLFAR